ncbi:uncharacterized protein MONBRDRAFT_34244 [Monosiga brevicollis MX1]|uniref:EamA domain-containing protein n=1 Tax=Monosiga brevicollis TaxID=81824 RepID=A9VAG3_MONBE|nr:uncharacterized protein MONBRDRAFT_34244 [Monosiga brevicollis MX1]EDQ85480.1 predicted protein [Monosiga brevicollis MX1]|eukprot:XP_001749671.1 hypothetical protein [Monosiga brevicollis MX1]
MADAPPPLTPEANEAPHATTANPSTPTPANPSTTTTPADEIANAPSTSTSTSRRRPTLTTILDASFPGPASPTSDALAQDPLTRVRNLADTGVMRRTSLLPDISRMGSVVPTILAPGNIEQALIMDDKSKTAEKPKQLSNSTSTSQDSGVEFDQALEGVHVEIAIPDPTSNSGAGRMWFCLFLYALFASCNSILLRTSNIVDKHVEVSSGTYICLYYMGDACSLLTFASVNFGPRIAGHWGELRLYNHVIGALAGLTNAMGIVGFTMLNANDGEASLLAPLASLYVIVPIVAGFLCLGDRLTKQKALGIGLGLGATMMFAFGGGSSFDLGETRTLLFFFITIAGWGLTTPLLQMLAVFTEVNMAFSYCSSVVWFVAGGFFSAFVIFGDVSLAGFGATHVLIMAAGACHGLGNGSFVYLSQAMPDKAAIVAPLSSLYVLIPVIVGMVFLDEAVTALKIVGAICTVAGALLMGVDDLVSFWKLLCGGEVGETVTGPVVVDDEGHVVMQLDWKDVTWDDNMHLALNPDKETLREVQHAVELVHEHEHENEHADHPPLVLGMPVLVRTPHTSNLRATFL